MPRPSSRAAATGWSGLPAALVAACAVLIGFDAFRLGFFADDFLFLDAARRMPAVDLLLGKYGVWPWYRPLSRESYFWIITHSGALELIVARVLAIASFAGAAVLLYGIGTRVSTRAVAGGATLLFVTSSLSKMLVTWGSGFQDNLATALTLGAVGAHAAGRRGAALALAIAAPFAKETGLLAFPLMWAWSLLIECRPIGRWLMGQGLAALAVVAAHLLVRTTWPRVENPEAGLGTWAHVVSAALAMGASFVTPRLPVHPLSWAAGILVALLAAALLYGDRLRPGEAAPRAARSRPGAFLWVAALLGVAPLLALALIPRHRPATHFFYPAIPWLCLSLAHSLHRLRFPWRPAVLGLVAVNALGLGYRPPDLDSEPGWRTGPLSWEEAERIWGRTERLATDLRAGITGPTKGLVVLYVNLPSGSWFQTGDGPATREILADTSVRAHFIDRAPRDLPAVRTQIMVFDPVTSHHLEPFGGDRLDAMRRAVGALVRGHPRAAHHWATYADTAGFQRFLGAYVEAATRLPEFGVEEYAEALRVAGLADSLAPPAVRAARTGSEDPLLAGAFARALSSPLSAPVHQQSASDLESTAPLLAALELRIATALESQAGAADLRLARILVQAGFPDAARDLLREASRAGGPSSVLAEIRDLLADLDRAPAPPP